MLCLAAGAVLIPLMADQVTLSWRHSVEKTLWQEDWRLVAGGRMALTEARVEGSGAGMEPPAEARLIDGVWRWRPALPAQAEMVMRRSGATADWQICARGRCQAMDALLPAGADPVTLKPCR
jgi:hypothetical protein